MEAMKVQVIVGARPNFMKAAPIVSCAQKYGSQLDVALLHTGQHYDKAMSKIFFEDLGLPKPEIYLGVGSGTHAKQTGTIMIELERVWKRRAPDLVLVVGDVNSTMAAAITAAKCCIPIAHVEAGLRSFDRSMPEEINRIVTDSISKYLFTTCRDANKNLENEGHPSEHIHFVGNVMIDMLLTCKERSKESRILLELKLRDGKRICPYVVVTLHRPSNVDNEDTLSELMKALHCIAQEIPIIFPVHPRTKRQILKGGFKNIVNYLPNEEGFRSNAFEKVRMPCDKILCIDPVGYLDFINLISNAGLVITDSGGIQEETTILKVPCLTLRENTERPVTITEGTNRLGFGNNGAVPEIALSHMQKDFSALTPPELWDGKAAERIVKILLSIGGHDRVPLAEGNYIG